MHDLAYITFAEPDINNQIARSDNMDWADQHSPRFERVVELVERRGEDLHVLEVGAEPYHITNRLLASDHVSHVTVINLGDRSESKTVRLQNGTVDEYRCNVETDPWPIRSPPDVIVMAAILEHLFHPTFALRQARLTVAHGGRLVLSTPNGLSLKTRVETALGLATPTDGFALRHGDPNRYDRHQHEYSRHELHDLLLSAGWDNPQIEALNLSREGIAGKCYERVARGSLADQWVVGAHAGRLRNYRAGVYRDSVRDRYQASSACSE